MRFTRSNRYVGFLAVVVLLAGLVGGARAEWSKEFPELAAVCAQISQSDVDQGDPKEANQPLPADAEILAFEENPLFLYALAGVPSASRNSDGTAAKNRPVQLRRILLLKPSVAVVDDPSESPALSVVHLQRPGEPTSQLASSLKGEDGRVELTVPLAEQTFRLELPPPSVDAGWVTVQDVEGKAIVARRPLPAGVLPHGPDGMRLIERWDNAYREGRTPGWDTGQPADDLKKAVESGAIRPCRTVELGCGSGTNAIYLAGKGFDVTAIDVAPTALGIAAAKAEKAGVKVRWLLADVLALPELEPFELMFDRGCYHNVRYVDAVGFVESCRRLSRPGTRFLVLSLNRDGPPGVREQHMRGDFSRWFDFEKIEQSSIHTGKDGETRRASWYVMLRRKGED